MATQSEEQVSGLGVARPEFAGVAFPFNKVIRGSMTGGDKDGLKSVQNTLDQVLSAHLVGLGNVQLVELKIIFKAESAGDYIYAGFCHANKSIKTKSLGMYSGGIAYTANSYNYGTKHTETLMVPVNLTRQIQPVSSQHPATRLQILASKNMEVILEWYIHFEAAELADTEFHFQ